MAWPGLVRLFLCFPFLLLPRIYRIHHLLFFLQQRKSLTRPDHFVCFKRFSPGQASEPLEPPFSPPCTATRRDFHRFSHHYLHPPFFTPVFPPEQHDKS